MASRGYRDAQEASGPSVRYTLQNASSSTNTSSVQDTGGYASALVQVVTAGTVTSFTVLPQAAMKNSASEFVSLPVRNLATGEYIVSGTGITAAGMYEVNLGGAAFMRTRLSALSGGSSNSTVSVRVGFGQGTGGAIIPFPNDTAGKDAVTTLQSASSSTNTSTVSDIGGFGKALVQVYTTGTVSAFIVLPQGAQENSASRFQTLPARNIATGEIRPPGAGITLAGIWEIPVEGVQFFRTRLSTLTGGSANSTVTVLAGYSEASSYPRRFASQVTSAINTTSGTQLVNAGNSALCSLTLIATAANTVGVSVYHGTNSSGTPFTGGYAACNSSQIITHHTYNPPADAADGVFAVVTAGTSVAATATVT